MNLKMIGIIIAIVGIVLLLVAFILGIVIGLNDQTTVAYYNMDDPTESDADDANAADESNALLMPINMGLSSFGMGLTFIGAGMALAKDNKGNMLAMIFGIVAAVILLIAFVISIYMGVINHEQAVIYNKDYEDYDGDMDAMNCPTKPCQWYAPQSSGQISVKRSGCPPPPSSSASTSSSRPA